MFYSMERDIFMRVNSVNSNYYRYNKSTANNNIFQCKPDSISFQGKHTSAKWLGGTFGTIATFSMAAGSVILSGGLSIPAILAYGAIGTAAGALIGHTIDKSAEENKNLDKKI